MRQNQNNKRGRGRGRRGNHVGQQNFNRNTTFESNGPEGRLRGNAQQLFEKYTALAQDAQASGERVSFEAFSQFADHYYRIHQTIIAASEQRRSQHEDRQRRHADSEAQADTQSDAPSDSSAETAEASEAVSEAAAEDGKADKAAKSEAAIAEAEDAPTPDEAVA